MKRLSIVVLVFLGMLAITLVLTNVGGERGESMASGQNRKLSPPRTATAGRIQGIEKHSQASQTVAMSLFGDFPAKPDHSLRVAAANDLIDYHIERGELDVAMELVKGLQLAPRWLNQAKLVRGLFHAGRSEEAQVLLEECLAGASYFGGFPREMIDVELAAALAAGGMEERAWQTIEAIVDDARSEHAKAKLVVELFRMGHSTNISVTASNLDMPSSISPEYLPAAEALLDIIPIILERNEDPKRVENAIGLAYSLRDYVAQTRGNATRFYLKLATIYGQYGEIDLMADALASGYPHFMNLSAGILDYYKMVSGVSLMADAAGRRDVAVKLLAEAPKGIALLSEVEQPMAWAHLGAAAAYLGNYTLAESHFLKAMQETLEIPNPPAARYAAIRVALLMAQSGADPGEEIVALLGGRPLAAAGGLHASGE